MQPKAHVEGKKSQFVPVFQLFIFKEDWQQPISEISVPWQKMDQVKMLISYGKVKQSMGPNLKPKLHVVISNVS